FNSDIYSLGCLFYYALTGKSIYDITDDSTQASIMMAHLQKEPIIDENLNPKLKTIILKMLEKDPNKRAYVDEILDLIDGKEDTSGTINNKEEQKGSIEWSSDMLDGLLEDVNKSSEKVENFTIVTNYFSNEQIIKIDNDLSDDILIYTGILNNNFTLIKEYNYQATLFNNVKSVYNQKLIKDEFETEIEYLNRQKSIKTNINSHSKEYKEIILNHYLGEQELKMKYNPEKQLFDIILVSLNINFQLQVGRNIAKNFKETTKFCKVYLDFRTQDISNIIINYNSTSYEAINISQLERNIFRMIFPNNNLDIIKYNGLEYREIESPHTGRVWLDRNLGAKRVATSINDKEAYGDYFQWGRDSDGHEKYNSEVQNIGLFGKGCPLDIPNHSRFITLNLNGQDRDWKEQSNDNLWQGANSINCPCPQGYRLPTINELNQERIKQNIKNNKEAFDSFLKLPSASIRYPKNGDIPFLNSDECFLWSSTVSYESAMRLDCNNYHCSTNSMNRSHGIPIRCIKDED
ncbi:MAG: serine/threonine-protein kinase, partial [Campylobacterota bacterium]|nr:serine/threonine-protein kinase [Campylobacterota bacterium]